MGEWIRVLKNGRFVAFVFFLAALNAFVFAREQGQIPADHSLSESIVELARDYQACILEYSGMMPEEALSQVEYDYEERRVKQDIWDGRSYNLMQIQEKLIYLNGYPKFLEHVEENYETYHSVSVFAKKDGFSLRNLEKTKQDFTKLHGVELTLENDLAVEAFFDFSFTDYVIAVLLLALCLQLLEERRNGFEAVIHTSYCGRGWLALRRLGVLFAGSAILCVMTYGVDAALAFGIYGGLELDYAPQTLERFQKADWVGTMGEWLLRYAAGRVLVIFFLAAILFFLLSLAKELIWGFIGGAMLVVAEYFCYALIDVQSAAVYLKYLNLFVPIHYGMCYGMYLNVNLFGYSVSVWTLFWCLLFFSLAGIMAGTIWIWEKRYPFAEDGKLAKYAKRAAEWFMQLRNYLTFTGFEIYKQIFFLGGISVLLLLAFVTDSMAVESNLLVYPIKEGYVNLFYKELGERTSDETLYGADYMNRMEEYIAGLQTELVQEQRACDEIYEAFMDGEITYAQYHNRMFYVEDLGSKQEAFAIFKERAESLLMYWEETGLECRMVNPRGYEKLFGKTEGTDGRKYACWEIFFAILFFYSMLVYERQQGTRMLIRTADHGREDFFWRKIVWILMGSGMIIILLMGVELYNIAEVYGLPDLSAASGSLECLRFLRWNISIGELLLLLGFVRWILLCAVSGMILFISASVSKKETCLLICVIVFLMPAVLLTAGVDACRSVSLVIPLRVVELFEYGSSGWSCAGLLPLLVVSGLGAAGIWGAKKRWCRAD